MADKPILFSSPMVLALLAGRKTQTRRFLDAWCDEPPAYVLDGIVTAEDENDRPYRWPRTHAVGDRLWVRETLAAHEQDNGTDGVLYRADGAFRPIENSAEAADRWCALHAYRGQRGATVPPIHAPRWTSRITLDVTDVRVQRLQDISRADAVAEGIVNFPEGSRFFGVEHAPNYFGIVRTSPAEVYADLWNAINGPGAWEANPFVVAYTFRVTLANIDHIGVAA